MSKTIEKKLLFLRKIFEIVSHAEKDPMALEILRVTAKVLELRSDFSLIVGEYDKFLESSRASKN